VREVFGDDAGTGLVFLGDLTVMVSVLVSGLGAGKVVKGTGGGDVDGGGAELGVVEEQGGFCCAAENVSWNWGGDVGRGDVRFFLEGDGGRQRGFRAVS
jgi:hypothetical protein